jgi:hypothetical protein
MKFTQPCFIRKNTPELRKKLEELGYEANSYECFWDDENRYIITTIGSNGFAFYTLCIKNCCILENKEFIDCGDNEELFLAIAALRTDSPDYQWFLWEHNDGEYHPELEESWKQYIPGEHWQEWWWFEVKKATVQQLIDKFTN